MDTLTRLEATIAQRLTASPEESYVAKLHAKGLAKIAQKLGEEATEAVIAALAGDEAELVGEAADVIFHLMVLLAEKGVKNVAVVCPAFSADCLETLEEMIHENKDVFMAAGGEQYRYIAALNDNADHIDMMVDLVKPYIK